MYLNITDICSNNHSGLPSLLHFACTRHYNVSAGLKASGKWSKNRSILFLYHFSLSFCPTGTNADCIFPGWDRTRSLDRQPINRTAIASYCCSHPRASKPGCDHTAISIAHFGPGAKEEGGVGFLAPRVHYLHSRSIDRGGLWTIRLDEAGACMQDEAQLHVTAQLVAIICSTAAAVSTKHKRRSFLFLFVPHHPGEDETVGWKTSVCVCGMLK